MIVVARFAECMNIDLLMLPMHSEISETGLLNFVDVCFLRMARVRSAATAGPLVIVVGRLRGQSSMGYPKNVPKLGYCRYLKTAILMGMMVIMYIYICNYNFQNSWKLVEWT